MGQVLNTKNAHATHVLAASTGVTWGPGRVHSKPGLLVRYTWNSKSASLPLGASHIQSHVPCRVHLLLRRRQSNVVLFGSGCGLWQVRRMSAVISQCFMQSCCFLYKLYWYPWWYTFTKQTKNRNKTKQNNTAATAVRSTWNLPCFTTNLRECKTDWLKSGENHQTQTCSTDVTGTHQRRPESPTAALTWQASKYQRLGSLTVCI